jgi:hypothetical protein
MNTRYFGTNQVCAPLLLQTTRVKLTSSLEKLISCIWMNVRLPFTFPVQSTGHPGDLRK